MKKILIALCLVLMLCLMTSAALAYTPTTDDDYVPAGDTDVDSEIAGIPYDEVYRVHEYKFMDDYGKQQTHFVGDEGVYIIVMPTCTEKGIVRYVCSEPTSAAPEGDSDYDPPKHFHEQFIKPLGHDPIRWVTKVAPTCVDAGLEIGYCKRCGVELERKVIPALGHIMTSDYGAWTPQEKADYKPWDFSLVVPPMSSEFDTSWYWGRVIKMPTCTEEGEAIDFCPRCGFEGDHRIIEKLPHSWLGDWSDPNCLDCGYEWEYCQYCGTLNLDFDAPGSYPVGDIAEYAFHYDYHWAVVDGEDFYDWVTFKHDDIYAADDQVGDGYRVLEPDRFNHDWDNWVVLQDSTCHEEGFKLHWCKRCGDKAEVVIEKKEPVWVPLDSRLINCYVREVTFYCALCNPDGIKCKKCTAQDHAPYTVQFPVVSHVWKTRTITEPWCEEEGLGEKYCIYEGQSWHNPDKWKADHPELYTEHDIEPLYEKEQFVIPELGHDWSEWVLRYGRYFKDENDNEFGYWLRECTREGKRIVEGKTIDETCHKTEERVSYYPPEDPKCNHDWQELWIESDPGCDYTGLRRVKCSKCETEKWEEIPELGHSWGDPIIVKEPGCEEQGHYIYVCTVCDATMEEYPDPVGHVEITVPAVAPLCFESGWTEYTMCEACGATLVEPEEIPAIGYHNYEHIDAVEPTCTADGNTEGVVCTVCGDVMVDATVIPALGHDYKTEPGKAAACGVAGYTESIICSRCGDVKKAKEAIPALEHDWSDWAVTTPATTEAAGEETRVCSLCSAKEVRAIEKLPKDPIFYFVGDPTIDEKGWFTGEVEHDPTTTKPAYAVVRVSMYMPNGDVVTSFSLVRTDMSFKVQFPASMLDGALGFAAQVMAEVENPASPEAVFYGVGVNWPN